jgi:predicted ATPase
MQQFAQFHQLNDAYRQKFKMPFIICVRRHGKDSILRHFERRLQNATTDEPEAALSFQSCLGLIALLHQMANEGSQVILATHSPLLVSLPGATLLEVGDWGIRRVDAAEDLELVRNWRNFLEAPPRYLRYLLEE